MSKEKAVEFKRELANLINRFSYENGSNTPDWVLADFMFEAMVAVNSSITLRDRYWGIAPKPGWTKP